MKAELGVEKGKNDLLHIEMAQLLAQKPRCVQEIVVDNNAIEESIQVGRMLGDQAKDRHRIIGDLLEYVKDEIRTQAESARSDVS